MKRLIVSIALLFAAFFCGTPLSAQTSLARLRGIVADPSKAVIPTAEVIVVNEETGVSTRTQCNEAGSYVFPALPPGSYRLSASAGGFKTYQRKGIVLETADSVDLDIILEIGAISDTVTVTDAAPLLESTNAAVGQLMDTRLMQEMPMANRRSLNLVATMGAVVFLGGGDQSYFSLAGGRSRDQTFLLDGGNIQNIRMGLAQIDVDPPTSSIKEFKVLSNSYSAEYGGSAGGVVISTSKSGTNSFHGSVYEFFRNDALEAAGFFAPIQGTKKIKAPHRFNQYGGTLGGPIIKNRTHFFVSYEGRKDSTSYTNTLNVPTDLQKQGDFSQTFNAAGQLVRIYDPATNTAQGNTTVRTQFAGNVIPAARFDAISKQLIKYWPSPNKPPINPTGAQNFSKNAANISNRDNLVTRIDHAFRDTNRLYGRYVYGRDPSQNVSVYPDPIADTNNAFTSLRSEHVALLADTWTVKPTVVADFRYAYSRRKNDERSASLGSKIVEEIGLKNVPVGAFPAITVNAMAGIGFGRNRAQFPMQQHQIVNNWSWFHGKHFVRFGAEARQSNNYERARPSISGSFSFNQNGSALPGTNGTGYGFASFLLGFVNDYSLNDSDQLDRYSWYFASFLQDDWRVHPRLTLNLGVRWETDTPMADRNNRMNSFDPHAINPVSGTPGVVKFAGVNGWPRGAYDPDWNNFGPRFGFAWQPVANKWVVRGGFGVFFEHPMTAAAPNACTLGFSNSAAVSSVDGGVTPAFYFRDGATVTKTSPTRGDAFGAVAVGKSPSTDVTFFERNRRTGYALEYNLGIERQLPSNAVIELSYLGNLGRKMPVADLTVNQVPPSQMGAGNAQIRRPFPQFNGVSVRLPSLGQMSYHAALLRVEKRLSHGLSFLSTYTWSRNIGNIDHQNALGDNNIYQDAYNRRLDKGPSGIDIVHRFTVGSVYDLPWGRGRRWLRSGVLSRTVGGWTFGTIATLQSGAPFGVLTNTNNTNAFAAGTPRANILRDGSLPGDQRTLARWFDTSAFAAPAAYAFGNSARGILRASGRQNIDLSLNKRFSITERMQAKISGEFFNVFNHPDFAAPNHSFGAPSFGVINSQANSGRVVQLGLDISF